MKPRRVTVGWTVRVDDLWACGPARWPDSFSKDPSKAWVFVSRDNAEDWVRARAIALDELGYFGASLTSSCGIRRLTKELVPPAFAVLRDGKLILRCFTAHAACHLAQTWTVDESEVDGGRYEAAQILWRPND